MKIFSSLYSVHTQDIIFDTVELQKVFRGIFVGIPEHQKEYLVYKPSTRKIISSYDAVFDESFSFALAYTSQPSSEAMMMRLAVTYTPCATSSREQTGDIITFTQFEEGMHSLKLVTMHKLVTNPMTN